jgi:V-type H+-transporting ATPase subunit a
MYGDVGHGMMLFLFGLYVVIRADDFKHISLLYNGRYMITMMGFFGIYAGLMYNDLFSVGMDLFGSRWTATESHDAGKAVHIFEPAYDAKNMGGPGPYPFGLDPAWHGAANELVFVNSLKMKISVILGVVQMIAGLFFPLRQLHTRRQHGGLLLRVLPDDGFHGLLLRLHGLHDSL